MSTYDDAGQTLDAIISWQPSLSKRRLHQQRELVQNHKANTNHDLKDAGNTYQENPNG